MTVPMMIHARLQELCRSFKQDPEKLCSFSIASLVKDLQVGRDAVLAHLDTLKILGYISVDGDDITITESGLNANLDIGLT